MEKQEFIDTLTQIGTEADEVKRRELLTTLNNEAATLFDSNATLSKQNEALTASNEDLLAANMKLFRQVGQSKSSEERQHDTTGIDKPEPTKKRKYEDLFNEKGELK